METIRPRYCDYSAMVAFVENVHDQAATSLPLSRIGEW